MAIMDISEVVEPGNPRRWSFYFALIFVVLPVWLVVPACYVFVCYNLATGDRILSGWKGHALFAVAVLEVLFNIYYTYLARTLRGPTATAVRTIEELETTWIRVVKAGMSSLPADEDSAIIDAELSRTRMPDSSEEDIIQLEDDDPRAADFRNAFRTWFGRVPWSQVRKHELRQWLHWAIFNTDMPSLDEMPPHHRAALERAVQVMEKRLGRRIPEGSNPAARPLRLSLDKFNVHSRPLIMYSVVYALNYMTRLRLEYKYRLTFSTFNGLEYCIHRPDSWDINSDIRPIVFFHGLGLGILQYKMTLSRICRTFSDRPLLVVLQPHVSQNIFHPQYLKPMTREQTTETLARLLDHLGWANASTGISQAGCKEYNAAAKGVTMLSHSNGTYGHAWMLKDYPHMVTRSCFVDPVTFCSWEGDVCYNFLYRQCSTGFDLIVRYFVGRELGVANVLQRRFDWSSNTLWFDEIPNARDLSKTLFVLGGKDSIVNAKRIKDYLMSHGITNSLYFDNEGHHGQPLMLRGDSHTRIMTWLRQT